MTCRSRMAEMFLSSTALQFGQCCMSMSKTRLSSRAQLVRCGPAGTMSISQLPAATALVPSWGCADGPCSTTGGRSFAFGARTPCSRNGGAAHFAHRSYADTKPDQVQPRPRHQRRQPLHELQRAHHRVIPSRHGVLSLGSTCPAELSCTRSSASAGWVT
jgi:hypothetical protein